VEHDRFIVKMLPVAGLATLMAGCASTGRYPATPTTRSLGAEYAAVEATAEAARTTLVPDELQLTDAWDLALRYNPELAAFSHALRAAGAQALQAGVLPNPELELAVDSFDRHGQGFDAAETSALLGQLFELGGKRRWRMRIANAEGELAGWDYEAKRLDVLAETAQRFTTVLAAQERLALARSGVELATQVHQSVSQRVEAGKEPPLQASKSEAELAMARLKAQDVENALEVARRNLAAMWGTERAVFVGVRGELDVVPGTIPSMDELLPGLAENPDLARWEEEFRLRRATLSAERAARIPDIEGSVGYIQFEEDGTEAFAFGIRVPLPLFDRNRGNIASATHGLAKAEAERSAAKITLSAELAAAHAALRGSHQRVATLLDQVVPAMERAYQAAREGYEQGKFGFLDVLDAQRGLVDARTALLDARSGYQRAVIDIRRLTGTDREAYTNKHLEE